MQGQRASDIALNRQALDVLAMGAPVLIPRLAFNLLSENMLFVSMRAMMRDFALLTILAVWSFVGFLLSMFWLSDGNHTPITISKWMLWVWFGLDGTGVQRSPEFHRFLGPVLMVLFALLGNTLFLTILVSMLSTTFSKIEKNSQAEIMFRRAVLTFEGVKSDALFAYQPPFNLIALCTLLPLKFMVSPRWFHKINVAAQRGLNLPILLMIGMVERKLLWKSYHKSTKDVESPAVHMSRSRTGLWDFSRGFSVHGDINRVFESLPADEEVSESEVEDATVSEIDDEELLMGEHRVRPQSPNDGRDVPDRFDRAFAKELEEGQQTPKLTRANTGKSRRDSVIPWIGKIGDGAGGLSVFGDEVDERLANLEAKMDNIEALLSKLVSYANQP